MVIFVAILLLTPFLAHGMVPDGTYRQIFLAILGLMRSPVLLMSYEEIRKWGKMPNFTPLQST
jgi:hypothetical protein